MRLEALYWSAYATTEPCANILTGKGNRVACRKSPFRYIRPPRTDSCTSQIALIDLGHSDGRLLRPLDAEYLKVLCSGAIYLRRGGKRSRHIWKSARV